MRLLRTETLELEEFMYNSPPPYAILSHTWGPAQDEVLFKDMESGTASQKAGFIKLELTAKQAKEDGLDYCWIDTCCIDKSSSAELQEAINSMYAWYENAKVCYAYLSDVEDATSYENLEQYRNAFGAARWFTRGWTLQELIAPSDVRFYTRNWSEIGTKSSLAGRLASVTRIDQDVLQNGLCRSQDWFFWSQCKSAAVVMSWAARRQTSRVEDIAYCLLGLFQVNIPMLYGEGAGAFQRLQEAIFNQDGDQSLFAWREPSHHEKLAHGLFADHPSQFEFSQNIKRKLSYHKDREPSAITTRGVRIDAPLQLLDENHFIMVLDCEFDTVIRPTCSEPNDSRDYEWTYLSVAIILSHMEYVGFARVHVGQFIALRDSPPSSYTIHVKQTCSLWEIHDSVPRNPPLCPFTTMRDGFEDLVSKPILLSDADSREWGITGWTRLWLSTDVNRYKAERLVFRHEGGEKLTLDIRMNSACHGIDRRLVFNPYIWKSVKHGKYVCVGYKIRHEGTSRKDKSVEEGEEVIPEPDYMHSFYVSLGIGRYKFQISNSPIRNATHEDVAEYAPLFIFRAFKNELPEW